MSYSISFSCTTTYITVKVTGDISGGPALEMNRDVHRYGAALRVNRYLVDLTGSRNIDSDADNHDFMYQQMPSAPGIDPEATVALLVSPEDHSHDFMEQHARPAGLNVRLFRDRDAAEAYLTAG